MEFSLGYVELKNRLTDELYDRVTLALDILTGNEPPPLNENCGDCNFFKGQSRI